MAKDRDILSIVELMWDATTDVDKWESVLRRIAEVFDSPHAKISYFNVENRGINFTVNYNLPAEEEPLYIALVRDHQDPLEPYVLKYPGRAFHCRMFHTDEQVHETIMYKSLLGPSGYEYRMGFTYPQDDFVISLGLMRGADSPPYAADDCEQMALLVPHLKQATRLHAKFAALDLSGGNADAVLDRMPVGIVVAARSGEIVFANQLAAALLKENTGLVSCDQRLAAADSTSSREIARLIAEAVDHAGAGVRQPGTALSVPRPTGGAPLSLLITPIWSNITRYRLSPLDRPLAVIFITDPDRRQATPAELLRGLFGLSTTESKILEALVAGLSVAEIAGFLGRSEDTIRSHVKSILQKTATHRQADLIKLVMSSTAWLATTR